MGADEGDSGICCDKPPLKIEAVKVAVVDVSFDEILVECCDVLLAACCLLGVLSRKRLG